MAIDIGNFKGDQGDPGTDGTNGIDGISPTVTTTATALANGLPPTAVTDNTDPANPTVAFGIPAGDTGAQGPQGLVGPAGSASIFLTDTVTTTIPTRWTTRGTTVGGVADTTNFATYIEAHLSTNGLCRFYTGATVVVNALFYRWCSHGK